ncbi:MAG: alanine--tRNA ligase-related protein [bacterium]|nr:alanine--tRNA ligase-related protein [bacterium]
METEIKSVQEIKSGLIRCHKKRGYKIYESFPILSEDPTVMFTNAAITPFKHLFLNSKKEPENFAIIQNCFRMGGSTEMDLIGVNPYCHTFFEMFGSGTFRTNHAEATQYLLDILSFLGLEKDKLNFIIPNDGSFKKDLIDNDIGGSKIFILNQNKVFWQEWKFGKFGLVGNGLTVVYSRNGESALSIDQMILNNERFIELLNLIYVYGQETQTGEIVSIPNPGFDLGLGVERLAAIIQKCNSYQINSLKPLVDIVADFFKQEGFSQNETKIRILTDHLKTICILVNEGVMPSKKKQGYVLRKLIRRYLELLWTSSNKTVSSRILINRFCEQLNQPYSSERAVALIEKEELALCKIIKKTQRILEKKPDIDSNILNSTFGFSPGLALLKRCGMEVKK